MIILNPFLIKFTIKITFLWYKITYGVIKDSGHITNPLFIF